MSDIPSGFRPSPDPPFFRLATPDELLLDETVELLQAFKRDNPLVGMEIVESPFIPPGVTVLQSRDQMAFCYHDTGKIVVAERHQFSFRWGGDWRE